MNVCVVGMGYMGIPTALLLAKSGHKVTGYDIDAKKIELLQQGKLPFEEKGMAELFESAKENFHATTTLEQADAYIITVPTPARENTCDLQFVEAAAQAVAAFVKKNVLVVLESTVRPRTTVDVVRPILETSGVKAGEFLLAYVSEKAIPGNTLYEMVHNDRILGGYDEKSSEKVKELYASFVTGPMHLTDCTTAEVGKLIENAYRDVNIALANELALLARKWKIDVWRAIELANRHPRVNIHTPGPGVGGHCIPLDPWFLLEGTNGAGLIKTARTINDAMPRHVMKLLQEYVPNGRITLLGATYKKNVDDTRETPTEKLIELLEHSGYTVVVVDPHVRTFHNLTNVQDALTNPAAVVIMVDHDAFLPLKETLAKLQQSGCYVLDTRNLYKGAFATLGNGTH